MTMTWFPVVWYPVLSAALYLTYIWYLSYPIPTPSYYKEDVIMHTLRACIMYILIESGHALARGALLALGRDDSQAMIHIEDGAHVIIAAHKAAESVQRILPSVLSAFPARRIWVADNGREPDTAMQQLCLEEGIHYRFYSIPNKTYALYRTAEEVRRHDDKARAVLLLDDDTELPQGFVVRKDLLDEPLVGGYCVGIGIHRTPPWNLWEHLVDFEYRTISYRHGLRAQSSNTIPFLHGICAVYHLDRMIMLYSKLCTLPDGLPFGEDAFAGIDFRQAGYRLLQDNQQVVLTYCPRRLFPPLPGRSGEREQGFGASSLWKQRTLRWYLSWPRRIPSEAALFLSYDAGGWIANVLYRLDLLWYALLMVVSSGWPFYIVRLALQHQSWVLFGVMHASLYATSVLTATIRLLAFPRPLRLDVKWPTLLLVPLMNITVCILMAFSFALSLLWYIPLRRINYQRCYALAR